MQSSTEGSKKNINFFNAPMGFKNWKNIENKILGPKIQYFFFEPSVENVDFNELLNGIFEFPVGIIPREGTAF